MEIGAFYTEGSNRIKVEIYSSSSPITVNLLNSNVSDSKLSILDSDDTETREKKLSKFIDRSIVVEEHNLTEGKAEVYFNFLDFDISSYMIEAICGNEEKLCNINTIEVENSPEQPYYEDHISDIQNNNYTELEENVFDLMPGTPIVDINFTNHQLVLNGDASVDYTGGGNRYLTTANGMLVKQAQGCNSINDRYSPFQLGTNIKCENSTANLFGAFTYDSNIIGKNIVQVQKGLTAETYKSTGRNPLILTYELNVVGTVCFSVLLASDRNTKATISINSNSKEIELTNGYEMYYITDSCSNSSCFKIELEDYTARLFVLLPQIEENNYPTSRVVPGQFRAKDFITVKSEEANIVFNPEGSETTVGGFVNLEFVAGREFSDDNCFIDWRNEDEEGLIIYQDSSNSIIASFGEGYSVRSLPVTLEIGEHYEIKVQWDTDNLAIQVNDEDPIVMSTPGVPFPEEYPEDIKVGWSEEYNSMNCDIVKLQIGQ